LTEALYRLRQGGLTAVFTQAERDFYESLPANEQEVVFELKALLDARMIENPEEVMGVVEFPNEPDAPVPDSVAVVCEACGNAIRAGRGDVYWQRVEGWERPRAAGGRNTLALRWPQQRFMCGACMAKQKSGLAGQETLI